MPTKSVYFTKFIQLAGRNRRTERNSHYPYKTIFIFLYLKLKKNRKAIKSYKKVIRLHAENEWAYLGLGHAYGSMHENSNAIAAYKRAIEINPKNAEAHYGLGVIYDRTVSLTYAFEQYKILKTLDKGLADKLYHIILGN